MPPAGRSLGIAPPGDAEDEGQQEKRDGQDTCRPERGGGKGTGLPEEEDQPEQGRPPESAGGQVEDLLTGHGEDVREVGKETA
jgi:hypothetical protein